MICTPSVLPWISPAARPRGCDRDRIETGSRSRTRTRSRSRSRSRSRWRPPASPLEAVPELAAPLARRLALRLALWLRLLLLRWRRLLRRRHVGALRVAVVEGLGGGGRGDLVRDLEGRGDHGDRDLVLVALVD